MLSEWINEYVELSQISKINIGISKWTELKSENLGVENIP